MTDPTEAPTSDPRRPECAEVSFSVEDAMQGHWLAPSLLERLAVVARGRGADGARPA